MNTLQVTLRDRVGERFNGYGLHRSLRQRGHSSRMLVIEKDSDDPDVHSYTRAARLLERGLYAAERMTGLQGMLSPFGWTVPLRRCFRDAQVVHWHLVYPHYLSLFAMPPLARRRPTVWTLHDPWAMTGHCVHPLECTRWKTGCGHCPDLSRNFAVWVDTTALVWKTKRAAFRQAPVTLVVSSQWMRSRVVASPLLAPWPCHVIPFGLDLERWSPPDRATCRARLGIPAEARVLAFRMQKGRRQHDTKGLPWLFAALERLRWPGPVHLIALQGVETLDALRGRYVVHQPGWIAGETQMAELLAAADLFLMPSAAESFGMMALEAMACRTPVVVTAGTALVDTARVPEAGVAVPPGDAPMLAATIERLLADEELCRRLGERGRAIVEQEHTWGDYVRRHEELYRSLVPT